MLCHFEIYKLHPWISQTLLMHNVIGNRPRFVKDWQRFVQLMRRSRRFTNRFGTPMIQVLDNTYKKLQQTNTCQTQPCETNCQNSTHMLQFSNRCKCATQRQHCYQQSCHAKRKCDNIEENTYKQKSDTVSKQPHS